VFSPCIIMVHNFRYEDHPVAIKIFIPARTEDAPLEYEAKFLREIKLLSKIEHSNIIKVFLSKLMPIFICYLLSKYYEINYYHLFKTNLLIMWC
jgi:serine/threonine protein kinase